MKQIVLITSLLTLSIFGFAQKDSPTAFPQLISFKLKNNSVLPTKVTVISYRPDETGNGTNSFVLMSYCSRTFKFPTGTKIYLANADQVNTVMSGAKIDQQNPFLIVKKEDESQIFKIN
jgi:hypothetical protein